MQSKESDTTERLSTNTNAIKKLIDSDKRIMGYFGRELDGTSGY